MRVTEKYENQEKKGKILCECGNSRKSDIIEKYENQEILGKCGVRKRIRENFGNKGQIWNCRKIKKYSKLETK